MPWVAGPALDATAHPAWRPATVERREVATVAGLPSLSAGRARRARRERMPRPSQCDYGERPQSSPARPPLSRAREGASRSPARRATGGTRRVPWVGVSVSAGAVLLGAFGGAAAIGGRGERTAPDHGSLQLKAGPGVWCGTAGLLFSVVLPHSTRHGEIGRHPARRPWFSAARCQAAIGARVTLSSRRSPRRPPRRGRNAGTEAGDWFGRGPVEGAGQRNRHAPPRQHRHARRVAELAQSRSGVLHMNEPCGPETHRFGLASGCGTRQRSENPALLCGTSTSEHRLGTG